MSSRHGHVHDRMQQPTLHQLAELGGPKSETLSLHHNWFLYSIMQKVCLASIIFAHTGHVTEVARLKVLQESKSR